VTAIRESTAPDYLRVRCWREIADAMVAPHCHDDLEMVLVDGDECAHYHHLGRLVPLVPGQVTIFWATYPHNLERRSSGVVLRRVMVPLGLLLSCDLPGHLVAGLLAGQVLSADVDLAAMESKFVQWDVDSGSVDGADRKAMLLEITAWLQRIAPDLAPALGEARTAPTPIRRRGLEVVSSMVRYIVSHFHEPIGVTDVAKAVGLQPQYAMRLFRSMIGHTITEYLARYRIAEAQRLLVATGANMADVAFAAGFGSVSQFYDHFRSTCGQTPRQYRLGMRAL
jgi:AraC family transcriptional regulator, melibiose operon regulatory protein